ncbi:thioesterase II family protein [Pseudomonas aeruginosa]
MPCASWLPDAAGVLPCGHRGAVATCRVVTGGFRRTEERRQLIADLRGHLQGTPEEVLGNREPMSLTLPILRADFLLLRQLSSSAAPAAGLVSIRTLGGREDKASEEQLLAWAEETRSGFELELFDGGHFFIHQREAEVLAVVERQGRGLARGCGRRGGGGGVGGDLLMPARAP